jgi:hypothetical protein
MGSDWHARHRNIMEEGKSIEMDFIAGSVFRG